MREEDPSLPSVKDRQDLRDGLNEAFSGSRTLNIPLRDEGAVRLEPPKIITQSVLDEVDIFLLDNEDIRDSIIANAKETIMIDLSLMSIDNDDIE